MKYSFWSRPSQCFIWDQSAATPTFFWLKMTPIGVLKPESFSPICGAAPTWHWKRIVCSSGIIRQSGSATGSMEMTFQLKKYKKDEKRQLLNLDHHKERRKIRRSAGSLKPERHKGASKYWMGKRVSWRPRDIKRFTLTANYQGILHFGCVSARFRVELGVCWEWTCGSLWLSLMEYEVGRVLINLRIQSALKQTQCCFMWPLNVNPFT